MPASWLLSAWISACAGDPGWPVGSGASSDEASPATLELTLEDAYRLALERNLDLAVSAQTEKTSRFLALGSWGAFDPVFSVAGTYGDGELPQSNPVITGGVDVLEAQTESGELGLALPITTGGRFDLGLTSSFTQTNSGATAGEFSDSVIGVGYTQPLLRGAGRTAATAAQRESEALWLQSRESQRDALEGVLLDVANAYWDLAAARELVRVRELSVQLGVTQVDQVSQRIEVGLGAEVDLIQAETQVSTQNEQLLLARNLVAVRADALRSLIFRPLMESDGGWEGFLEDWDLPITPLTPLPEEFDSPTDALAWKTSLERARLYRADLGQLRLQIDAAEFRLELAENSVRPVLDLSLGYQGNANRLSRQDSLEDAFGFDFPSWSASLTFQRPLRNRTLRFAERAAREQLISARIAYERAENQVITLVRDAVRDIDYRTQAVLAARQSRRLAERQLSAEERRQQEGLSTTFQVLQFQRDLAQALANEAQARSAYARAEAALLRAEGRLVTVIGKEPIRADRMRTDTPDAGAPAWHWLDETGALPAPR